MSYGNKQPRGKKRQIQGLDLKYLCLRVDPDVHEKLRELAGSSSLSDVTERLVRHYYERQLRKMDKHSNS